MVSCIAFLLTWKPKPQWPSITVVAEAIFLDAKFESELVEMEEDEAREFLAEMAHILNVVFSALRQRGSRYASVLGALIELAGEKAAAVALPDEAPIDDSWAEPAAFDGCSVAGQARADQPQPIQIQRKTAGTAAGARP